MYEKRKWIFRKQVSPNGTQKYFATEQHRTFLELFRGKFAFYDFTIKSPSFILTFVWHTFGAALQLTLFIGSQTLFYHSSLPNVSLCTRIPSKWVCSANENFTTRRKTVGNLFIVFHWLPSMNLGFILSPVYASQRWANEWTNRTGNVTL